MRIVRATAAGQDIYNPLIFVSLVGLVVVGCSSSSDDPLGQANNPPPSSPPPAADDVPPRTAAATSLDNVDVIGTTYWSDGTHTPNGGQGGEVEGLPCEDATPVPFHIHAHLSIFLNAEALTIPGEIGFVELSPTTDCHYQLHTHDGSGILHMHATEETVFTLGQFFAIWGQPLARDNVADFVQLPIRFYVTDEDDVVEDFTGDPGDIVLSSHREVTIMIGTEIAEIPNYTWSGD